MPARAKEPSSPAAWANGGGSGRSRSLSLDKAASWALTSRQVANIMEAAGFAAELGLPLNRFITVNWEAAGVPDGTRATGHFLKLARDWLRRLGHQFAYVWVQERGHRVGQHAHVLAHVPKHLARRFSELQRGWLKRCGAKLRKGLIKTRPVGRSRRSPLSLDSHSYRHNLHRVVGYLLKQGPRAPISRGQGRQGSRSLVLGKRCATSENIGRRARSLAAVSFPTASLRTRNLPDDFE